VKGLSGVHLENKIYKEYIERITEFYYLEKTNE
jgi:hypothetical protein